MSTNDKDCRPEFEAWLASCGKSPLMWNTSDAMLAAWAAAAREQREALARVEAELSDIRHKAFTAAMARDTAQAQLADVLYILDQHRAWTSMGWEQLPVPVHAVEKIRSKVAQAEQQEAQGAQAGDERAAFEKFMRSQGCSTEKTDCSDPVYFKRDVQGCWITWQARAALATQPAAGEPVKSRHRQEMDKLRQERERSMAAPPAAGEPVAWRYRTHGNGPWYVTTNQKHARVFEGTEDGGQVQGLYAAPPAAAHGDDAVRKMVLPERIDRKQYLGGRGDAVAQGWNDCLSWIDKANAMRAQGDGEVQ